MKILPQTKLGYLSVGLTFLMFLLFLISSGLANTLYNFVSAGNTISEDISRRPLLAFSMFAAITSGLVAFIIGMVALLKNRDQAILVIIATITGLLLLIFLVGEVGYPNH